MRIMSYASILNSLQQEKRMDTIANNLANAGVPGFKKERVYFKDFMTPYTVTDQSEGPIRETGNALDIALHGEGYLTVQTDKGPRYTRAGNLRIDAEGTLVTQDGWPVLVDGAPLQITGRHVRIEPDGQIFDENGSLGTLDLVVFPKTVRLIHEGRNLLKPSDANAAPQPAENCSVQQGALEEPNFSVVEEMSRMIDTLRTFEAAQKLMNTEKQADQELISKLGS